MKYGYIKLHRKIKDWGWYKDSVVKSVFLHLLLSARFEDGEWQGVDVKNGQVITSSGKISDDLGLTRQQVRTALQKLRATKDITTKTTSRYTLVTVVNWELYQSAENFLTNCITGKQPASNQQTTNNQPQYKKDNNIKNDDKERDFRAPSLEEVQAYCSERNNTVDSRYFVDFYESKGWMVGRNKMKDWKAAIRSWEKKFGRWFSKPTVNFTEREPIDFDKREMNILNKRFGRSE